MDMAFAALILTRPKSVEFARESDGAVAVKIPVPPSIANPDPILTPPNTVEVAGVNVKLVARFSISVNLSRNAVVKSFVV